MTSAYNQARIYINGESHRPDRESLKMAWELADRVVLENAEQSETNYEKDSLFLVRKGLVIYQEYGHWSIRAIDNSVGWHGFNSYNGAIAVALETVRDKK